jgi:flagellar biosynthesis/type III secretory pathway protein FliH
MSGPRARVIRGEAAQSAAPLLAAGPSPAQGRRIARTEMDARTSADRLLGQARAEADALRARAQEEGAVSARRAVESAREEADTQLAARWLALRKAEGERLERETDRVVSLAVVLAERLLGASLDLAPARIADIARGVIAEARGARRATIEAHPSDAEALRVHLPAAGLPLHAVEIRPSDALARGELLLHTDLGTIDAKLSSRLDRLAEALRDALR